LQLDSLAKILAKWYQQYDD